MGSWQGKRDVRREIDHYNLDVIIAIGYRVQSPVATRFKAVGNGKITEVRHADYFTGI